MFSRSMEALEESVSGSMEALDEEWDFPAARMTDKNKYVQGGEKRRR